MPAHLGHQRTDGRHVRCCTLRPALSQQGGATGPGLRCTAWSSLKPSGRAAANLGHGPHLEPRKRVTPGPLAPKPVISCRVAAYALLREPSPAQVEHLECLTSLLAGAHQGGETHAGVP